MTIKELYEWATDNNVENFDLEIVGRDYIIQPVREHDLFIDRLHEEVEIETKWL